MAARPDQVAHLGHELVHVRAFRREPSKRAAKPQLLRQVRHRHPQCQASREMGSWNAPSSRSDDHCLEHPRCDAHRKYRAQIAGEVMHLAKNDLDQA